MRHICLYIDVKIFTPSLICAIKVLKCFETGFNRLKEPVLPTLHFNICIDVSFTQMKKKSHSECQGSHLLLRLLSSILHLKLSVQFPQSFQRFLDDGDDHDDM